MLTPFDIHPSSRRPAEKRASPCAPLQGDVQTPDDLAAARGIANGLVITGLVAGALCVVWMLGRTWGWF